MKWILDAKPSLPKLVKFAAGWYLPYRLSLRPNKQLVYLLLERDSMYSKGLAVGLDLGCGRMANRPIFQTDVYYGIEVDAAALERGQKKHPEAVAVLSNIEETQKYPNGDFVVCVQVFHNRHFNVSRTLEAVVAIVGKVNTGGNLLINFGRANGLYADAIENILLSNFTDVLKTANPLSGSQTVLAPLVAARYLNGRGGRTINVGCAEKIYFRCLGKRAQK